MKYLGPAVSDHGLSGSLKRIDEMSRRIEVLGAEVLISV